MKGLSTALIRLSVLPDQARLSANRAANIAAEQALRASRSMVPVRTGRLRASLRASPVKDGAALTTRCPYAVYVELGTRYMRGKPFLKPAMRAVPYPDLLSQAFKEAIR